MKEVRIRWADDETFDAAQIIWAALHARWFADEFDPRHHTGQHRAMITREVPALDGMRAESYFTPTGIVVVNIHGETG